MTTDSVPLILDVLAILVGALLNKNKIKSFFYKQISDQWKQLCGQTIKTVNDGVGINPSKLFFH